MSSRQLLSQLFWAPTEISMAPPIPLSWDLVSPSVLIRLVETSASFTPKISAFSPLYLHIWLLFLFLRNIFDFFYCFFRNIFDFFSFFLFFRNSQCGPFLKSLGMCYNIDSVVCVLCFWQWVMWDLSSLSRDQTLTLCFGRWSLNCWTTGKVPYLGICHSLHVISFPNSLSPSNPSFSTFLNPTYTSKSKSWWGLSMKWPQIMLMAVTFSRYLWTACYSSSQPPSQVHLHFLFVGVIWGRLYIHTWLWGWVLIGLSLATVIDSRMGT